MRGVIKSALVLGATALAIAVPAAAKQPTHPTHPTHPSHPSNSNDSNGNGRGSRSHSTGSRKCTAHNVAYIASGTLVTFAATESGNGLYTGSVTVDVTRTNRHAAGARNSDVTYTLNSTRVRFGRGASTPVAGERVSVIGKITALAKRCDQSGFTPTVTLHKVTIRRARGQK